MIDQILSDIVKKQVGSDVAILMGGGVDSATLLFTCLRQSKKVHGYSFFMEDEITYDSLKAEEICKIFNVPFTPVPLPKDNLVEDFKRLALEYKCKKKTHFECVFPLLYTFPKIKEKYVLSGIGADSHYVLSKKGMMHYRHSIEKMDEFRNNYFNKTVNPGGINQFRQLCSEYNKKLCVPYFEPEIYDYFYGKSWEEINKPEQKYLIKSRFKEFNKLKLKPHLNYQLDAKIDKAFETLLNNKEINVYGRNRIMDICRDWSKMVENKGTSKNILDFL